MGCVQVENIPSTMSRHVLHRIRQNQRKMAPLISEKTKLGEVVARLNRHRYLQSRAGIPQAN